MPKKQKLNRSFPSAHARRLARSRLRQATPARSTSETWIDPPGFAEALDLHMRRHGESAHKLWRAIVRDGDRLDPATLVTWRGGRKAPRSKQSLTYLARIEERYRLPKGYFIAKFPNPARAIARTRIVLSASEQRRLAWHLPDDFEERGLAEQKKILDWVRETIISGATDYRRFQRAAMKHRYAIPLPRALLHPKGATSAPGQLVAEMKDLLTFKTSTLTPSGYARNGVWESETAAQKTEHLGLLFGALSAPPTGPIEGLGIPKTSLTLALLAFPAIWDWYVAWRHRRRGFLTTWEADMLTLATALTAQKTGWLRQTPHIATNLIPIEGMISASEVQEAMQNWSAQCDRMHDHALTRAKEIQRISRVHRDPFEPILPILEADSPLGEYRRIAEAIEALMPSARHYPKAAAEARRALLMVRLGLHLGVRQKNLRQLLVRRRDEAPSTDRHLEDLRRGEMRWSDRANAWEVYIPANAFKNSRSSFFAGRPFRLLLPNLAGLYAHIERYVETDRAILIGSAKDPGAFFVKSAKSSSVRACYDQSTFYEAWRLITQRYAIYNPWTQRGAIKGLLPHGPHNVRDVLATHILKQTGSFEQASYAIQDTPAIVAKHYGRFLPENKAALAAKILNEVWQQ